MRKLLEKSSKEKLLNFLEEYAKKDTKFANAVNVHFGKPEFEEELKKIEGSIDDLLDGISDYYYARDRWGYVNLDTSCIIAEIKQRTEQGHVRLAFAETEMLYRKLLENFEYQGECEISDKAEYCLEIMSAIADKAVETVDKKYIFKNCIALAELDDGKDYGADYEDKLLSIAAKFVTLENRAELEGVLARFDFKWREEAFKLIRLDIIRKIENEDAVVNFIAENLRFPKIRDIAFDKAMSNKRFEECERLCIDAIAEYTQNYGVSPWLYKLYSIYEMMGNESKMAATAEKILFCGDLEYYSKLTPLLKKQSDWNNLYSELIKNCELNLPYSKYMEILAKEEEHALLLEQVKKHSEQVYRYGKMLAEKYPADTCAVFTEQIGRSAEAAYGRDSYSKVCSNILSFAEAGFISESIEMLNDFKQKYRRKPAFVDELNKIRERLI
ncbi:MAG: hypothetical protein FWG42_03620 [Clostridiales bacterium]|nr:hypothetical protein [Clostridiales bacterium]